MYKYCLVKSKLNSPNTCSPVHILSWWLVFSLQGEKWKIQRYSTHSHSQSVSSVAQSCLTLWDTMDCSTPGLPSITNSQSLLKLMSIELVMPSNHLILCHPRLLLPSIFPRSGSFPMSWFFPSGGQSIGVSASTSVLPIHIQDWFPLGGTGWISLLSKGLSRVFSTNALNSAWNAVANFLHVCWVTAGFLQPPRVLPELVLKVFPQQSPRAALSTWRPSLQGPRLPF